MPTCGHIFWYLYDDGSKSCKPLPDFKFVVLHSHFWASSATSPHKKTSHKSKLGIVLKDL